MKKTLIILVLLLVGFPIPSFAIEYQHKFSEFMCTFAENEYVDTIKIYDFEYQKDYSDEKFTKETNNNFGVYPGNMVKNKCRYDLHNEVNATGLHCFTSVDYDLINVFLPYNVRRYASLLTIFPDESATIYTTKNSNIPFNKFIDNQDYSKGFTREFNNFALITLDVGKCVGSN